MTVPIIDEDLWLDRAAFDEIIALVAKMQARIRQDERPLRFPPKDFLLGAVVKAGGGAPSPGEIRGAATFGSTAAITLEPFPCFDEDIGPLKADPAGFRTAMLGVLAHEASHVAQWTVGHDEQAHQASATASLTAKDTKLYSDYVAYLATPLELAAHSTQLAVEVWTEQGDVLDQTGFQDAAVRSSLWTHMTDHPDSPPACADSGAREFASVREPLLSNGWWIYQRLMRADVPPEE